MRISVFGLGYVGTVGLGCLAQLGHKVIGVDLDSTKVDFINEGKSPIVEPEVEDIINSQRSLGNVSATTDASKAIEKTDISFICVGTPSTQQGHLNLDSVYKVTKEIGIELKYKNEFHVLAIRSTVPPGTIQEVTGIVEYSSGKKFGRDFAVVSNPEFLREGTAVKDFYDPPFTLLGSSSEIGLERMKEVYKSIQAPVITTTVEVSELLKYVNNSFHALKITFANEVGNICKSIGVDARELMRVFCLDKKLNISSKYLKPGFAYGGSCLPKDLKALATIAHDYYLKSPVIESIVESNESQKELVLQKILDFKKQKIGFLGLSFKAGTDDLRFSPAVDILEKLIGKGFDVMIYDRNVHFSSLVGANRRYILERIPLISRSIVGDLSEVIKKSELLVIVNGDNELQDALSESSRDLIIFDLIDQEFEGREDHCNYVGTAW